MALKWSHPDIDIISICYMTDLQNVIIALGRSELVFFILSEWDVSTVQRPIEIRRVSILPLCLILLWNSIGIYLSWVIIATESSDPF